MEYNFKEIENRWKEKWYSDNIYKAVDFSDKPKKYILAEFPYPSGKSMHVGHMMRYTLPEIYSRFLRMQGYNVMFPMGWDAFGLPAENYAIKMGVHPAEHIKELVAFYKSSMQDMGYGIDWDREVNTTDPNYYKWTQWIFLKLWEEGLAELREEPVWWSEKMKTVLAEEEVLKDGDGNLVAERDGSPVEKKMLKQWVLKMPVYADKLIEGLSKVDFPDSIKSAQINWIGRKEGINISYPVVGIDGEEIICFTTRPDTNFGATFLVLSPEHPFITKILNKEISVESEVYKSIKEYVEKSKAKTDLERISEGREKTGVDTTFRVKNRLNEQDIPVWISDFVLPHFGTGAVVGVPGHDMRDFQFATKFQIPIIRVVVGPDGDTSEINKPEQVQEEEGKMINSGFLDGMEIQDAIEGMKAHLEKEGWGTRIVNYNLKDWLFSRQRYWGEPIPLIHTKDGGVEAIAKSDNPQSVNENLPLVSPDVPDYEPTSDGASPLARNEEWVNAKDSKGNPAKRETNTMPNWAGSCWYFLRYIDPKNDQALADMEKMKYWLPVDHYFGGSEHTTMHLLYSRFWHKFLYDQGIVPTEEPYQWRMNGGILLGPDGSKMSKSKGNVIEPQEKLEKYGADAVRMYIAFIGPYDGTFPYNESSLKVCHKVIRTIYELRDKVATGENPELERKLHKMIRNVTRMAEDLKMNTIVSEYMVFVRDLKSVEKIPVEIWKQFIRMIAPMAVFTSEELWQEINEFKKWDPKNSVHLQGWPKFDSELVKDDMIEIPIQIDGKRRGVINVENGASEDVVRETVMSDSKLQSYLINREIKKFIYVENKIVNIVSA